MWLISNGDMGTVTKMVLVHTKAEMIDAVRTFCRETRTNFDDVVINSVDRDPDTDAKDWLAHQLATASVG
jgi:hypothetical protein